MTLDEALRETVAHRWAGMRSLKRNLSQAGIAVATLEQLITGTGSAAPLPSRIAKRKLDGSTVRVEDVRKEHLKRAVHVWRGEGAQAATIIARLNCLSAMGLDVQGCRPRLPRKLQWWLNPEQEATVIAHLRGQPGGGPDNSDTATNCERRTEVVMAGGFAFTLTHGSLPPKPPATARANVRKLALADLIVFIGQTGLRVEEALALKWSDILERGADVSIMVRGTKTQAAQAVIPITAEAATVLGRRRTLGGGKVFGVHYHEMQREWVEARKVLGLEDPSAATLKALRRTAARTLHAVKGMPLDILRQVLRHERINTTMGYLRLTGGYGETEIRRWL